MFEVDFVQVVLPRKGFTASKIDYLKQLVSLNRDIFMSCPCMVSTEINADGEEGIEFPWYSAQDWDLSRCELLTNCAAKARKSNPGDVPPVFDTLDALTAWAKE